MSNHKRERQSHPARPRAVQYSV